MICCAIAFIHNLSDNVYIAFAVNFVKIIKLLSIRAEHDEGSYVVTNTGEYAYIIINSFINPNNEDKFSIEENINFNGYEIAQRATNICVTFSLNSSLSYPTKPTPI